MKRTLVSSGSRFEPEIGFSRAVRVGNLVCVSGTAPIADDGSCFAPGDLHAQTRRCLHIIARALGEAGASLDDVVRTRVFLTDVTRWRDAARAHGEVFGEIRPASSFLGTSALIDQAWLVEIEADAFLGGR